MKLEKIQELNTEERIWSLDWFSLGYLGILPLNCSLQLEKQEKSNCGSSVKIKDGTYT